MILVTTTHLATRHQQQSVHTGQRRAAEIAASPGPHAGNCGWHCTWSKRPDRSSGPRRLSLETAADRRASFPYDWCALPLIRWRKRSQLLQQLQHV